MLNESPENTAQILNNDLPDGWARAMGVQFLRASPEEVVAQLDIGQNHRQPYGILHGGVHCGLIETLASVGAALVALPRGQTVVGLENHTTFVRAARAGMITGTARPIVTGRRTQVWEGTVRDAESRILATGRVRLMCLEPEADLAGQKSGIERA